MIGQYLYRDSVTIIAADGVCIQERYKLSGVIKLLTSFDGNFVVTFLFNIKHSMKNMVN